MGGVFVPKNTTYENRVGLRAVESGPQPRYLFLRLIRRLLRPDHGFDESGRRFSRSPAHRILFAMALVTGGGADPGRWGTVTAASGGRTALEGLQGDNATAHQLQCLQRGPSTHRGIAQRRVVCFAEQGSRLRVGPMDFRWTTHGVAAWWAWGINNQKVHCNNVCLDTVRDQRTKGTLQSRHVKAHRIPTIRTRSKTKLSASAERSALSADEVPLVPTTTKKCSREHFLAFGVATCFRPVWLSRTILVRPDLHARSAADVGRLLNESTGANAAERPEE
ncbi:hypothetical protein C8R47DRAFT_1064379 [Mycena vitilis]|nr:hypothetical protein C8R47DRAFT_1064379 [Mycena vitilis]